MWKQWNDYHIYELNEEQPKDKDYRFYWLFKQMKGKDIKTILDVGCGNGWHCKYFHTLGYDIQGIDISEAGIKMAKRLNPKIAFKVQNAEDGLDGSYDVVFCLATLNCMYFYKRALEHIFKVAKKWVYITTIKYQSDPLHKHVWTSKQLKGLLGKYGKVTSIEESPTQIFAEVTL